ncbi:hypothetical protein AFLA70_210g001302 [Aspergillus flavus AF70]|nr:hypothetical protein AFLA70_210g001302 [Aspergillus flavus AF70]
MSETHQNTLTWKGTRLPAGEACNGCRERKRRCVRRKRELPCLSCQAENRPCDVSRYRRRRRRRRGPNKRNCKSLRVLDGQSAEPFNMHQQPDTDSCSEIQHGIETDECGSHCRIPSQSPGPNPEPQPAASTYSLCLPSYVTGVPKHLALVTLNALREKGAFTLPPAEIQTYLISSYIMHVHPNMPFLDLERLLEAVILRCRGRQTSMLLLQAVMFAGSIFLDPVYLHLMGYTSRRAAMRDLFGRAKLLYECGFEVQPTYKLQSLLLFTLFHEDDLAGSSFWMGEAWNIAKTIGLQYDLQEVPVDESSSELAFRRRLWWCVYTRDRLLALSTRSAMHISDGDYNVPMLALADFKSCFGTAEAYRALQLDYDLRTDGTKTALALTFIYKIKLSQLIGRVLMSQYTIASASPTTMLYYPRLTPISLSDFLGMENDLDVWETSLPSLLEFPLPLLSPVSQAEKIIYAQRAMLHMIYLTCINALHRPWSSSAQPTSSDPWEGAFRDLSAWKIEYASQAILMIATHLHSIGLTNFLADTAVPSLLSAMITHIVRLNSDILVAPEANAVCFVQGWECLQGLREKYEWARHAAAFIRFTTRSLRTG